MSFIVKFDRKHACVQLLFKIDFIYLENLNKYIAIMGVHNSVLWLPESGNEKSIFNKVQHDFWWKSIERGKRRESAVKIDEWFSILRRDDPWRQKEMMLHRPSPCCSQLLAVIFHFISHTRKSQRLAFY